MKPIRSRTETINIRGLRYAVRHWGHEDTPTVFFLHGWMDSSPTFQFVVDALKDAWHVIAPDWRGYGESEYLGRPYWFPDYYADLDCLLNHYSPRTSAKIVAHSMGANIAGIYAGIRPERVSQLVLLDFLGLKPAIDDDSPTLIGKWLNNLDNGPPQAIFQDPQALAKRLMALNPRLTESRAERLSWTVSRNRNDGLIEMACDPWHRVPSPMAYRVEDAQACWRKIEAPVRLLIAQYGLVNQRFGNDRPEFDKRIGSFRHLQTIDIPDSGHNVQHDQPERVAAAIEQFLTRR